MSSLDKDELNHEVAQIDARLEQIRDEIHSLQVEKESLSTRRKECLKLIKDSEPSSIGGSKHDTSSNWNRTGGGKSLCFQLPALVDVGFTLVVSPLVSLVEDQLWYLKSLNIYADTLNAASSKDDVKRLHSAMCDAESSLKMLYVTPEKLAKSKMFMNKLQKAYEMGRFRRLVIDEVHCCSTYGHDFRPDYKFLGVIKQVFPNVTILGLTATATQMVIDDVKKILNLSKCVLFKAPFNRPNIFYQVREKPSNHEECMNEMASLILEKFHGQSGIVYCFSQRESEQVALDLSKRGVRAGSYHAQMESAQRTKVHESWLRNRVHVIVATIAFGMGIDKSNCRFVIHHSLSKSLENFYQESGRAGRDGLNAWSILFYRFGDVFRQSSMVFTEQTGLVNLYSMVNYCIDVESCKRTLIAQHFNDDLWDKSGKCNGMCDRCSSQEKSIAQVNCIVEARLVCEVIDRNNEKEGAKKETRVTANKLAELVHAELSSKRSKLAGNHNNLSKLEIESIILIMLMRKYLKEDFHFTPYNTICYVVNGPKSARLGGEANFLVTLERQSSGGKSASIKRKNSQEGFSPKSATRPKKVIDDDDCEVVLD